MLLGLSMTKMWLFLPRMRDTTWSSPLHCFLSLKVFSGRNARVPLPRTPAVLDIAYDSLWRRTRAVKTFGEKSGTGKYTITLEPHVLRSIHPSVPLLGDPSYLGCYSGAGLNDAPSDVPWRWL